MCVIWLLDQQRYRRQIKINVGPEPLFQALLRSGWGRVVSDQVSRTWRPQLEMSPATPSLIQLLRPRSTKTSNRSKQEVLPLNIAWANRVSLPTNKHKQITNSHLVVRQWQLNFHP